MLNQSSNNVKDDVSTEKDQKKDDSILNNEIEEKVIKDKVIEKNEVHKKDEKPDKVIEEKNDDDLSLDIESMKGKWSTIITNVTNVRTSIGIVLEHSSPIDFDKKVLKIGVYNQPKFSLDLLNNNKEVIEKVIANELKQRVSINFSEIHDKSDTVDFKEQSTANKNNDSDAMDSVIELFDGEILR